MVPVSIVLPHTMALYSRLILRFNISLERTQALSMCLARMSRPVVSRSRRLMAR